MKRFVLFSTLIIVTLTLCGLSDANAQIQRTRRSPAYYSPRPLHKVEITPLMGYAWTGSRQVYILNESGRIDVSDSEFYGIAIDVNTWRGSQVELLYRHQGSTLTYKGQGKRQQDVTDVSVDYWHLGGIYGVTKGKVMTYAGGSAGVTYLNYDFPGADDDWRFSFIFSLGAKLYLNERFGLRVQSSLPFTLISGGAAIGCGPGGCYSTVGGEAVSQIDLSAGIMVLF
jgi:hypothetical protein